jgi:hypothetical protein
MTPYDFNLHCFLFVSPVCFPVFEDKNSSEESKELEVASSTQIGKLKI